LTTWPCVRAVVALATSVGLAAGCGGNSEVTETATSGSWDERCRAVCDRGADICAAFEYETCLERCDDMVVLVDERHRCYSEANGWLRCAIAAEYPCKLDNHAVGLLPPACETERQAYWACYDRACNQYPDASYCPHR